MGTLFPWNVFITERAYFDVRLFVPPYTPALANSFESIFGVAYMVTNLAALAALVRAGGVDRLSPFAQVPAPLLGMAALLALTGGLACAPSLSGDATMGVTLATLLAMGALTAVVQGGSFAVASVLPPVYNQALMGGQAAAGVVSAAVAMASTLTLSGRGGDDDTGGKGLEGDDAGPAAGAAAGAEAAAYFLVAAALVLACAVGCLFLHGVPFYRHHALVALAARSSPADDARDSGGGRGHGRGRRRNARDSDLGSGADRGGEMDDSDAPTAPLLGRGDVVNGCDSDAGSEDGGAEDTGYGLGRDADEESGEDVIAHRAPSSSSSESATTEVACYRAAVLVTFALTLSVFPAVTSSICSARNPAVTPPCVPDPPGAGGRFFGDLWVPFFFVVFNVMDLFGRCAAGVWPKKPPSGRAVLALAIARLALLPPLLMCNVVTAGQWDVPRLLATSDLAPAVLISALAFTNGHVASTCMMFGPALVPLGQRAEEGSKMSLAVVVGLACGSVLSFVVTAGLQS